MKVGIVTIHNAYNYGAALQAFALKEYLRISLGDKAEVDVIDYRTDFLESKKKIHFTSDMIGNLIELEKIMIYSKLKHRNDGFETFMKVNDSLSEVCKTKKDVEALAEKYDVIISGSDQVWNFKITDGDMTYLLDFPKFNGKLMSYASSLGPFRFYEKNIEDVKKAFERYAYCSCREKDGCEYLTELTGREWTNVCDPTLLLDDKNYLDICNDSNVCKKIKKLAEDDYVLIYNLNSSDEIFRTAKFFAEKKNLKVYQIFPSARKNKAVDKLINYATPEELLWLYSKAKFIITNSFHGTCFSVIFKKQFYTINPAVSKNRLESMLDSLGISERLVMDIDSYDFENNSDIDYGSVDVKLKEFRADSVEFLEKALKD